MRNLKINVRYVYQMEKYFLQIPQNKVVNVAKILHFIHAARLFICLLLSLFLHSWVHCCIHEKQIGTFLQICFADKLQFLFQVYIKCWQNYKMLSYLIKQKIDHRCNTAIPEVMSNILRKLLLSNIWYIQ